MVNRSIEHATQHNSIISTEIVTVFTAKLIAVDYVNRYYSQQTEKHVRVVEIKEAVDWRQMIADRQLSEWLNKTIVNKNNNYEQSTKAAPQRATYEKQAFPLGSGFVERTEKFGPNSKYAETLFLF